MKCILSIDESIVINFSSVHSRHVVSVSDRSSSAFSIPSQLSLDVSVERAVEPLRLVLLLAAGALLSDSFT